MVVNFGVLGGVFVDSEGWFVGMMLVIFVLSVDINIGVNFVVLMDFLFWVMDVLLIDSKVVYLDVGW